VVGGCGNPKVAIAVTTASHTMTMGWWWFQGPSDSAWRGKLGNDEVGELSIVTLGQRDVIVGSIYSTKVVASQEVEEDRVLLNCYWHRKTRIRGLLGLFPSNLEIIELFLG
jgi:hypothetical protein